MTCFIIGCGQTATQWKDQGYSIGVNDCWKYGIITDRLIVVNTLKGDRLNTVKQSIPKDGLYSHLQFYRSHPNFKTIGIHYYFSSSFIPGRLYHATTSPFMGISMAFNMGFKEIVLYGVDFVDHPNVNGNKLKQEVRRYELFAKQLVKHGANVYLGTSFGALKEVLPLWNNYSGV